MSLRIRRGLEADRLSITPDEGELLYTTDEKKLYIGDGTTPGGNLLAEIPTLDDVTDAGNATQNLMGIGELRLFDGTDGNYRFRMLYNDGELTLARMNATTQAFQGFLKFLYNAAFYGLTITTEDLTANRELRAPNKNGTIAVTDDIPSISGKEDTSNKSTSVATDQASNTKYPSVKAVFDWVTGLGYITAAALTGYATQAWVNAQGFITNVATALGYTPENAANKKTNFSSPNDTDYPTTKAVNDAKEDKATATTGNAISFTTPQVYNSLASPGTGDITENLTGARIGVVQKIYHNKLVTPTFPAGWVRLGSTTYNAGNNNIIYAEWVSGTRVEYWIVRL